MPTENVMHVFHSELEHPTSCAHDSICPKCGNGVLHMRRSPKNFLLLAKDDCPICGQIVIYKDIMTLRKTLDS